jgi:hypothetical protein
MSSEMIDSLSFMRSNNVTYRHMNDSETMVPRNGINHWLSEQKTAMENPSRNEEYLWDFRGIRKY